MTAQDIFLTGKQISRKENMYKFYLMNHVSIIFGSYYLLIENYNL